MDRIDIHVEVPRVPFEKLSSQRTGELSATVRARVEAARALIYATARYIDANPKARPTIYAAMSKLFATDMAMRVADWCVQLHGGYGYCEEYPVARAWRDARVMSIFAGTNEIMKELIARAL